MEYFGDHCLRFCLGMCKLRIKGGAFQNACGLPKGAAAAGITGGGLKGMNDTDVQAQIRPNLGKRSLERCSVMPGEIARGFIFFPGESKKAVEPGLQIRVADTGKSYALIMKL